MKILCTLFLLLNLGCAGQPGKQSSTSTSTENSSIIVGAARFDQYLPLLNNKRVAILTNQTAVIGKNKTHLVDTLLSLGVNIVKIFGPEHGFRGTASAGATVENAIDKKTGIPIISLYGDHQKATPKELADVDVMVFDIQDVGTRFYTYISAMQRFMEAAAENNKPFIILDRPNPNGFYVAGPILEESEKSGVGMQPVPIVYGMTIGEYATMLVGEHWLNDPNAKPDLTIIKCLNYTHDSLYKLPVKPSPNLPNMASIYLYPSLCFFEGTKINVGRGTHHQFQLFGNPEFPDSLYTYTPVSLPGAVHPKLEGEECHGFLIATTAEEALQKTDHQIQLKWVLKAYQLYPDKENFFRSYFNLLAGTKSLMQQIKNGWSADRIRQSWQPGLKAFKKTRKKYLLYPDFTTK